FEPASLTPHVEKYLADHVLRGGLIANETNDEPKHPHVVARVEHLHCKPIAVRDSSDQHLVWCRLHFGLVTLVASGYRVAFTLPPEMVPPRHARQVFVRAAVPSLGISSRARLPLKAMVFASGEIDAHFVKNHRAFRRLALAHAMMASLIFS